VTATPRRPTLWDQATSTRGGRIAVVVAIVALCLLVGTAAVALAASARQDRLGPTSAAAIDQNSQASKDKNKDKSTNGNQGNGQGKGQDNGQGNGDLNSIPGRLGGTLHGEVTRPTATGGTETLLVQSGSVTASSATELSVKSSDGFTETYAVSDTTTVRGPAKAAGLAVGTEVTVVATKDGKRALLVASKGKPS
jgi:hypothetical protein